MKIKGEVVGNGCPAFFSEYKTGMAEDKHPPELAALIAEFEASGMAELHLQTEGYQLRLQRDAKPEMPIE